MVKVKRKKLTINYEIGNKVGQWLILSKPYSDGSGWRVVDCKCQCGVVKSVVLSALKRGRSSCCKKCVAQLNGKKAIPFNADIQIGKKYGDWTIISTPTRTYYYGKYCYSCKVQCKCGKVTVQRCSVLRKNKTQRCKRCAYDDMKGNPKLSSRKHGQTNTRLYNIWCSMKQRCKGTSGENSLKYYKERAIQVCVEWQDFATFYEWAIQHGYNDTLTIDRIDRFGNYEPTNCQWITKSQNTLRAHLKLTSKKLKQLSQLRRKGMAVKALHKQFANNVTYGYLISQLKKYAST